MPPPSSGPHRSVISSMRHGLRSDTWSEIQRLPVRWPASMTFGLASRTGDERPFLRALGQYFRLLYGSALPTCIAPSNDTGSLRAYVLPRRRLGFFGALGFASIHSGRI